MTTISDVDKEHIECFFSTISPWADAYTYAGLSYFSVEKNGAFNLVHGRLFLGTVPSNIPNTHFRTLHISAGHFSISEIGPTYGDFYRWT